MTSRIMLVSDFYPPFLGGTERQVQLLAKELSKLGHQVCVVTMWHSGLAEKDQDETIEIIRIKGIFTSVPWFSKNPARRFHPPVPDPFVVTALKQLIRDWKPNYVHAFGWVAYSCAAARALSIWKFPLFVSIQDYGYTCPIRTLFKDGRICDGSSPIKCFICSRKPLGSFKAFAANAGIILGKGLLLQNVETFHSLSNYVTEVTVRDLLRHTKLESNRIKTVSPIVILSAHNETSRVNRHSTNYLPKEPFILFVGALQYHKGLFQLLDAYQKLKNPPVLVLIGTVWPDTPKEFPGNVHVLKNLQPEEVMDAWKKCLFAVLPSVWAEPFGGVVLEAMSKGKAVIGSKIGGHPDMIVHGKTGFLVDPLSTDELTRAMETLMNNPELRADFEDAAKERCLIFLGEKVVYEYLSMYQAINK